MELAEGEEIGGNWEKEIGADWEEKAAYNLLSCVETKIAKGNYLKIGAYEFLLY